MTTPTIDHTNQPQQKSNAERLQELTALTDAEQTATTDAPPADGSWCYAHLAQRNVRKLEEMLQEDQSFPYFVHKTKVKVAGQKKDEPMKEKYTFNGLIFIQGSPTDVQGYFASHFLPFFLAKDCSTGLPAIIPHAQMVPFMHLVQTNTDRIRELLKPLEVYAKDNVKVRITTGPLAGMEGYIIRIHRNRCLVMDIGGRTVAISDIHKETVEKAEQDDTPHKA